MAKNKDLDSELNLIAFISLLSVLICALLLTAIWVQIGSMDVKQAVGATSDSKGKKTPSVWAMLDGTGGLVLRLQDVPRKANSLRNYKISAQEGELNVTALNEYILRVKELVPDLRTALIKPSRDAVYEDIISMMDQFKKEGLIDLGVAPL